MKDKLELDPRIMEKNLKITKLTTQIDRITSENVNLKEQLNDLTSKLVDLKDTLNNALGNEK